MSPRRQTFTCIVDRSDDGQVNSITLATTDLERQERSLRVNGQRAALVAGAVHDLLRGAGVSGRAWSSSKPMELSVDPGAQVDLLLHAVKPLRRHDRIDQVAEGVAGMSREEASYWHARLHRPGGMRALRVLLAHGRAR